MVPVISNTKTLDVFISIIVVDPSVANPKSITFSVDLVIFDDNPSTIPYPTMVVGMLIKLLNGISIFEEPSNGTLAIFTAVDN